MMTRLATACVTASVLLRAAAIAAGPVPAPLPGHPGNVFLEGEAISIRAPAADGTPWEAVDYGGSKVASGRTADGLATLGPLPVGWYEVRWGEAKRVAVGVLTPLAAPTPETTPIACDVAMAWFYAEDRMPAVANLCALAGVHWVRDRLAWAHMEPKKGRFVAANKYDASARIQAEAGLRVLQVNHSSPRWANPNGKRFPLDLRDTYRFHRQIARRWKGRVAAFEPWNEADIDVFGGHTGAEMASLQKAAYLGLKAGNPDALACLNVFAVPNEAILGDLHANRAWPYFETFNLHHYAPVDRYPQIYAAFRRASAGRPLWVTEFARPVPWSGDQKAKEPTEADLRVQAERLPQVFAASLHQGPHACFYFLLPHYSERQTQFGILRPDLTPRPAFIALAAVGRLLADARPVGRLTGLAAHVRAFLFQARPDGKPRAVLVAWTAGDGTTLDLGPMPERAYDHLGRPLARRRACRLSSAPVYLVFSREAAGGFPNLEPPPAAPPRLEGKPSPVVLQATWPKARVALRESAYRISSKTPETVPVHVYNFAATPVEGRLRVSAPAAWDVRLPGQVTVPAGEKADLELAIDAAAVAPSRTETIAVTGDFGPAGQAVLSLVVMPEPRTRPKGNAVTVPNADRPERWQPQASDGSKLTLRADRGGIVAEASLSGGDRWIYPLMALAEDERPPDDAIGLLVTLTVIIGEGTCRVVVREANGAGYVMDCLPQPEPGKPTEVVALFGEARHGAGWSQPDPDHRLDADQVRSLAIGCNPTTARLRLRFEHVRWLRETVPDGRIKP